MHRVVIVGGGFGGLYAARSFRKTDLQVTLVDRRNHHLFQPLLYQVATGALSPANIAAPLRSLLRRQKNAQVLLDEVVEILPRQRQVKLRDGVLDYDSLILATGSTHSYFGHPEWEQIAPSLKTLDDATSIRRKVLSAFEEAEKATSVEEIRTWLTFVIVGGGPTGVEMAGAVAELAHSTLQADFRNINPAQARILLVEGADRVLPPFVPKLSAAALTALRRLQVEVLTDSLVTEIEPGKVTIRRNGQTEEIASRTIIWAAGVQASPLGKALATATGVELDRSGRVKVQPDLTVPGHPELFVIGDLACCLDEQGQPLPALAPVAMQQGNYVARLILGRQKGKDLPPFRYKDYGTMATIGAFEAVCDLRGFRFSGLFAWLVWLFVHLMQVVQFENRLLVLMQWAWHYTTRNRSARLITGPLPSPHEDRKDEG